MKISLQNYIPKKRKEIILVITQFLIIFLNLFNFLGLNSSALFKANIYKNFMGISIIFIGIIGIVISIRDLGHNISPFPTPLKNSSLVNYGIYKFISHPMYYSCIFISFGIFVKYTTFLNLFLTISLLIVFKLKIKLEEEYLKNKFKNYQKYKQNLII